MPLAKILISISGIIGDHHLHLEEKIEIETKRKIIITIKVSFQGVYSVMSEYSRKRNQKKPKRIWNLNIMLHQGSFDYYL